MGDVRNDGDYAMQERPVHEVRVDTFDLGRWEVSVGEFAAFVEATGYRTVSEQEAGKHPRQAITQDGEPFFPNWRRHWSYQPPDHPVVATSWEDAIACCNFLGRRDGSSYRTATQPLR